MPRQLTNQHWEMVVQVEGMKMTEKVEEEKSGFSCRFVIAL